jgi:hypothetical protein
MSKVKYEYMIREIMYNDRASSYLPLQRETSLSGTIFPWYKLCGTPLATLEEAQRIIDADWGNQRAGYKDIPYEPKS